MTFRRMRRSLAGAGRAQPAAAALVLGLALAQIRGVPAADAGAADRFRILCDFDCGTVAADAALAAEAAWPLADTLFGAPRVRERPFEIRIYRTPAAFVAARSSVLRPAPERLAVTEPHSRSAHIALPPGVADTTLALHGLPGTVLRVVAHEAFHIAAIARAPGSARLPEWLVEGAASWAEHAALRAIERADAAADEPVASTYQWLAQRRLRTDQLPDAALILADSLPGLDDQERYAVRKLFFEYLRSSPFADRLDTGARAAASYAAQRSMLYRLPRPAAVRAVIDSTLLGADPQAALDSMDAGFHAHVEALRPGWVQTGRALDRIDGDRWLHVGLSNDATAWRIRYAPGVQLRGTARFLTGGTARLLVDSNGEGYLTVSFDRDAARLRVEHSDGGRSAVIHDEPLRARADGEIGFVLAARRGGIELAIDGRAPLTLDVPELEPNGAWGLGVSSGTSVEWVALSDQP